MTGTAAGPRGPAVRRPLAVFLVIVFAWALVVGGALFLTRIPLSSALGIGIIAVLYMPAPLVSAVIAERDFVKARFRLPSGGLRGVAVYLLAPVVAIVGFALLYLAIVFVAGDLLRIPGFGGIAMSPEAILAGAAALLGKAAVASAGPPPPAIVLLLAGIWGAVVAGWTVNGLFALGEEYGWRGLMWDRLRPLGFVRANLVIGIVWGLWHAPLIVQGYNYPGQPVLGVLAMVVFCIGMSFVLTALRERTGSVLPAAAAHGMVNALVPIVLLLVPGAVRMLTGPLGVLGAVLLLGVGLLIRRVLGRPVRPVAAPPVESRAAG